MHHPPATSHTKMLGTDSGKENYVKKPKARQEIMLLTWFLSIFTAFVYCMTSTGQGISEYLPINFNQRMKLVF